MKKNILFHQKKTLSSIGDTYHLTKVYLNYLCQSCSPVNSLYKYLMIFSSVTFILLGQNLAYSQITIDGNPTEWPGVLNNTANTKKAFKHDPFNVIGTDDQWTQGSKDTDASPAINWKWVNGNSNDKGDIGNAGAVLLGTQLYFFGDRAAFNGDAQIGFWFFLNDVMPIGTGATASPFEGEHANGDLLIISNFTNGGGIVQPLVYVWAGKTVNNPGALVQINANTVSATLASNSVAYNVPGGANGTAMFNGDTWVFSPKSGPANTYPVPLFFEGSLDLATIQGINPCFKRFLLETRNSQSLTASLQDLAAGGFSGVPPAPSVVAGNRCGTGSVSLSASGCTGTLNWYANATSGTSLGTGTLFNTPEISQTTTYFVSCTTDGCEGTRVPVIATINLPPTASASFTPIICNGGNSTLTVSASDGTPSYTYSIDDVTYQVGNTFSVVGGSYTVYVMDSKGCKGQYQVNISEPPADQPDISIGPDSKSYCGLSPLEAQAQLNIDFNNWLNSLQIIDTGTPQYTITTNPTTPQPPAYFGGDATVSWTITDACGKSETISEMFSVGGCNILCQLETQPTPCNVAGSISATGGGGFPSYEFRLYLSSDTAFANPLQTLFSSSNPGNVIFTGLAVGSYTVLIFDQAQNTIETASACSIDVTRNSAPPVTENCSNDQLVACGQSQQAIDQDYLAWFLSLAPTGGTNLQFSISVTDGQGNVVDNDGVFSPNKCGGIYTATISYSDDCSQIGNCQGIYTIIGDTEIPVITTQNQSGDLGCNPTSIVAPAFGYTDNCDSDLQVVVTDGGVLSDGCGRSQTWTANVSDGCNNAAAPVSITYTWKVDAEVPVITTQNQSGDLGCNPASIVAPTFGYTDNCDSNLQVVVTDDGVVSDGCSRSQIWTANVSDDCGNQSKPISITYTWKVDTEIPVITTQNQSGDLGCNPTSIVAPAFGYTDNCDSNLQVVVNEGEIQSQGCGRSQTWTANVSDGCGNAATLVSITYTWKVDTEVPVISTQNQSGDLGCNPTSIVAPTFGYTDNCDSDLQVVVNEGEIQSQGCGRSQTWTANVSDGCGNAATLVSITYTWKIDTDAPVITCPGDYSLSSCDQQPILELPTVYDNCDGEVSVTAVRSDDLALNDPFPIDQTITITYSAEDSCGNSTACDFTVYVAPCTGDTHCTYTQGFYGNFNGMGCSPILGQVGSQEMMVNALTNNAGVVNFGSVSNNNYFELLLSDINGHPVVGKNNIYKMLPGGGTPRALIGYNTYSTASTWSDNDPLNATGTQKGRINNVLLAQTMALFFNIENDPSLSSIELQETFATGDVTYCGSNTIIPETISVFNIDSSLISYLTTQNGVANVAGLYALANKALGGEDISPLNHSKINSAVDVINRGFDECRIQVLISSEITIATEMVTEKDFTIYPVPFISNFTILYNFDYESPVDIQVFNARGQLLLNQTDNNAYKGKEMKIEFPLIYQKGEIFFIRIETNKGYIIKNIVSSTN